MLYYRTLYHAQYIMPAAARVGGRLRNSKLYDILSKIIYYKYIYIYHMIYYIVKSYSLI